MWFTSADSGQRTADKQGATSPAREQAVLPVLTVIILSWRYIAHAKISRPTNWQLSPSRSNSPSACHARGPSPPLASADRHRPSLLTLLPISHGPNIPQWSRPPISHCPNIPPGSGDASPRKCARHFSLKTFHWKVFRALITPTVSVERFISDAKRATSLSVEEGST